VLGDVVLDRRREAAIAVRRPLTFRVIPVVRDEELKLAIAATVTEHYIHEVLVMGSGLVLQGTEWAAAGVKWVELGDVSACLLRGEDVLHDVTTGI